MPNLTIKPEEEARIIVVLDKTTVYGEVLLQAFNDLYQHAWGPSPSNLKSAVTTHRHSLDGPYGVLTPPTGRIPWLIKNSNIYVFEDHWRKSMTIEGKERGIIFTTSHDQLSVLLACLAILAVIGPCGKPKTPEYIANLQRGVNSLHELFLTVPTVQREAEQ